MVEDAGKAAAAIMVEPEKHYGKTYRLISNRHTLNELAVAFSQALGKDVRHEWISYETFRCQLVDVAGFSEENADAVLETYRLIDEESRVVNQPEYTPESSHFAQITGEKPTSLQEWVNQVAPSFKWLTVGPVKLRAEPDAVDEDKGEKHFVYSLSETAAKSLF